MQPKEATSDHDLARAQSSAKRRRAGETEPSLAMLRSSGTAPTEQIDLRRGTNDAWALNVIVNERMRAKFHQFHVKKIMRKLKAIIASNTVSYGTSKAVASVLKASKS
jgi:hypothetical protein